MLGRCAGAFFDTPAWGGSRSRRTGIVFGSWSGDSLLEYVGESAFQMSEKEAAEDKDG